MEIINNLTQTQKRATALARNDFFGSDKQINFFNHICTKFSLSEEYMMRAFSPIGWSPILEKYHARVMLKLLQKSEGDRE